MASELDQKLTLKLSPGTLEKAKRLAARRSVSTSDLITQLIEKLWRVDQTYESAHKAAVELMERGFDLGGVAQSLARNCILDKLTRLPQTHLSLSNRSRIKQRKLVVQTPAVSASLFAAAGHFKNQPKNFFAHRLNRRVPGGDAPGVKINQV
jgi:hypothetical protein